MYKVTVVKDIVISEQDIEDLVVTALNGGIGDWACLDNTTPEFQKKPKDECVDVWTAKILMDGGTVTFLNEEDRTEEWNLTLGDLLNGIKLYVDGGYDHYGIFGEEIDMCNCDAECADAIFQLALFEELVYG